MSPQPLAFFDVDGTLTTGTTLFRFLRYYLAAQGHRSHVYEQRRQQLKAMTAVGVSREDTNRAYFANFHNADAVDMSHLARAWFKAELARGGFFNGSAVDVLNRHKARGEAVVIVSGSFPAVLSPLAEHLGVAEVWATAPEITDGRYTGQLLRAPMIGKAKVDAARLAASIHRTDLADCYAYGDHLSDLPLLQAVGTPVVIRGDPRLDEYAQQQRWTVLPGAPEPPEIPLGACIAA
ncbi:HAD family phosphatase [Streptomyces sp. ISL-94]|uniref:HAD family hydrolase n=1 Tax=Streptomyces sp. ISL-94 TaxID=2819190 RepID=UPI001BE8CEBD|nr:HAD-IB family hydrolase [Streptomyces sp. ISL-94]MBT2481757.1 HAD-IB family hydrolase [Streptomyces sp. ISL-94]